MVDSGSVVADGNGGSGFSVQFVYGLSDVEGSILATMIGTTHQRSSKVPTKCVKLASGSLATPLSSVFCA